MKTALLISTYNWPEALDLVLHSVTEQIQLPDEVLIADDGSNGSTKELIEQYKKKYSNLNIQHFWQDDKGFRKSAILNKALAKSEAEYIIQVDGDCILHKHFIKDHLSLAKKGLFLYGSRVNIQKHFLLKLFDTKKNSFNFLSEGIKKRTRALRIPIFATFFKPHNRLSKKLRGCNMSYFMSNIVTINGFNEDFEGWGKEDSELATRLLNNGIQGKRIRYKGIVYHIWHEENSKSREKQNEAMQKEIFEKKITRCKNGLDKYLQN